MADANALLIGGAGYFGSRLAESLATDRSVTVTYRSRPPARAAWLASGVVQPVQFDSARDGTLPVSGLFDTIINLAMPSAQETAADPDGAKERALKTIDACLALLEAGQAERIIHFSTFHVYGASGAPDYSEDTGLNPIHPYGETHALVEERIAAHRCCSQVVVLRATNMVGAPAHADLADQAGLIFMDLCRQASEGHMELRNDGKSFRDVLTFPAAIEAVCLAATTPSAGGQIMNLAAGEALRLDALAHAIAAGVPEPIDVVYGEGSDTYRKPFHVSVNRLRSIGWSPRNDLAPEIKRTLAFFLKQRA